MLNAIMFPMYAFLRNSVFALIIVLPSMAHANSQWYVFRTPAGQTCQNLQTLDGQWVQTPSDYENWMQSFGETLTPYADIAHNLQGHMLEYRGLDTSGNTTYYALFDSHQRCEAQAKIYAQAQQVRAAQQAAQEVQQQAEWAGPQIYALVACSVTPEGDSCSVDTDNLLPLGACKASATSLNAQLVENRESAFVYYECAEPTPQWQPVGP